MQDEVAAVLYVNPPVNTSVLDLVRGRFEPSHLGGAPYAHLAALLGRPRRVAERVWAYTGSQKTLPLTRNRAIRSFKPLNALNAALYAHRIRACFDRLPGERSIVYLSHPLHAFALEAFKSRVLSCYDWTDDWTQFELIPLADRDEYARLNQHLPRQVDVVFAVSQQLYQRARQLNPNAYWLPNATSLTEQDGRSAALDAEVEAIRRPRLCYVGQIGDRVDFALLRTLAERRQDWSIVMIGPIWSNRFAEAQALGQLSNVHFVGPRPYAVLAGILAQMDVCLIPHTLDALTVSMDPIKLYDYLASGKPIVTTKVAGVDRFADVIYIGESHEDFISQVDRAISEATDVLAERRRACGRSFSWSARAKEFWKVLTQQKDAE